MLMAPGSISKTTSLLVHKRSVDDPGASTTTDGRRYRNMLTLLSRNGTLTLFDDRVWFHSTPCRQVFPVDRDGASGLPDVVRHKSTPLARALSDASITELEQDIPRSFLRTHFCGLPTLTLGPHYTRIGAQLNVPRAQLAVPDIRTGAAAATTNNLEDLDRVVATINRSPYAIGGTERKKNKSKNKTKKGGAVKDSFMITCKVEDYYYFNKNKTGLTILI
jgi:hypothetical protein